MPNIFTRFGALSTFLHSSATYHMFFSMTYLDIIDSEIYANRVDGVSINTRAPDGSIPLAPTYICVYTENLQSIANGDQNVRTQLNDANIGVDLRMTGNTRLIDANNDNLDMGGDGTPNTGVYDGTLEITHAINDGMGLKEGAHTFTEDAMVYACHNAWDGVAGDADLDFTPSDNGVTFVDETQGQGITCATVDGPPAGFVGCQPGCPADGTVLGAVCSA